MDATEAQLRFGASLTHSTDTTYPGQAASTSAAAASAPPAANPVRTVHRTQQVQQIPTATTNSGTRVIGFTNVGDTTRSRPEREGNTLLLCQSRIFH